MVDGDDVFVRSWKGDRGYWFQSATEPDAQVALIVDGHRMPVSVHDCDRPGIGRADCSRQLELKYADEPVAAGHARPRCCDDAAPRACTAD